MRLWPLFGHMVSAIDRSAFHQLRPRTPDAEDIPVQRLEIVSGGPEAERRAGECPPGPAILGVVAAIDRRPGAIVLQHGSDDVGIMDRGAKIGMVLRTHRLDVTAIPTVGVGQNRRLRFVRLAEEEPVPPERRKFLAAALQRLDDGNAVDDREALDLVRMVHRHAKGGVGAAVVPNDSEALVPESAHQRDQRIGLGAFGRGVAQHAVAVQRRAPEARKIWAHNRIVSGEKRRDPMPRRMGPRMAVQEQDDGTRSTAAKPEANPVDLPLLQNEALEHGSPQISIVASTGTWSDGRSQERASRSTCVEISRSPRSGEAQM